MIRLSPLICCAFMLCGLAANPPLKAQEATDKDAPAETASAPSSAPADKKTTEVQTKPVDPAHKPTPPAAPSGQGDTAPYADAGKVLFTAFALALFLESALAALFNWRPFVQTFVRGTRTVVTFGVALALVCWSPELLLFDNLVKALYPKVKDPFGVLGILLSAMMLAGGSAGINNLLVALGFRSLRTPESITPKPEPTMAWVSIRVIDAKNRSDPPPLMVKMAVNASSWELIGTIAERSSGPHYFTADKGRFPRSGGHAVKGGNSYKFKLADANGKDLVPPKEWGTMPIAAGAIIDIVFEV